MNLRRVILRYLGWCPGIESASHFSYQSLTLPRFSLNAHLIILTILATFGLQSILSAYHYWSHMVPANEIHPIIASRWRGLSDVLYCIGALGLTGLAAAVFRSGTYSGSHSKTLALILLSFGSSKLMSQLYFDIIAISSVGLRYARMVDIGTLTQYLWVVMYFYTAFRIMTNKPIISKPTFTLSSILCVSLIIRNFSVLLQGFPYAERVMDRYFLAASVGLDTLFLVLTLWFLVNGYRGDWSTQTLLADGLPGYLRAGLLIYGLRIILPILIGPALFTDQYLEEIIRSPLLMTSFAFEIIFGVSIILASIYPLNLGLREVNA